MINVRIEFDRGEQMGKLYYNSNKSSILSKKVNVEIPKIFR